MVQWDLERSPMYHRYRYYLKPKPIARIDKFNLWRGIAKKKLSPKAQLRLEWIIFFYTAGKENVTETTKHFGISFGILLLVFSFW